MRILVPGGAGYIGSIALAHLVAHGHEAWAYDDLSRGHAACVPEGRLIRGSLADRSLLEKVLREERIDAVMHFAAYALVGESVSEPALYWENNVLGSLSLLEAMRATGVKRLVFSSTCATYGEPERVPIAEDVPQHPVNPYGRSKLVVEHALADYARAYGLGFAALRYFNACGAAQAGRLGEDHEPETHLIPLALRVALGRREELVIHGDDYPTPDGTCVRDYVHVEDLAVAHRLALERLRPGDALFLNLGTGRGFSVREVIEACRRATGHPIPVRVGPRRPGDPPELVADPARAREVLGWRAGWTEIDAIVESAWRFHRQHPDGYGAAPAE